MYMKVPYVEFCWQQQINSNPGCDSSLEEGTYPCFIECVVLLSLASSNSAEIEEN